MALVSPLPEEQPVFENMVDPGWRPGSSAARRGIVGAVGSWCPGLGVVFGDGSLVRATGSLSAFSTEISSLRMALIDKALVDALALSGCEW